jgi:hypothetical protein
VLTTRDRGSRLLRSGAQSCEFPNAKTDEDPLVTTGYNLPATCFNLGYGRQLTLASAHLRADELAKVVAGHTAIAIVRRKK